MDARMTVLYFVSSPNHIKKLIIKEYHYSLRFFDAILLVVEKEGRDETEMIPSPSYMRKCVQYVWGKFDLNPTVCE